MTRQNSQHKAAAPVVAKSQIFIEATGVPGTSKRQKKDKCFEARTYECGNSLPPNYEQNSTGSHNACAPQSEEITITRSPDAASAVLKKLSILGKPVPALTVEVYPSATTNEPTYRNKYQNVYVTSYNLKVMGDGELIETVTFAFGIEKWEYFDELEKPTAGGYNWIQGVVAA
jgi:type VI protein secretion system component Hcp